MGLGQGGWHHVLRLWQRNEGHVGCHLRSKQSKVGGAALGGSSGHR
eukprot:CAMPEP_0202899402 /NCGR_PEP_ID=MMETSP1392-20130828/7648_1 /ASSEMBLY_ACC=CAM_ASM_000868 /TAXON_ID=225041 /ORGANISM="Chlamydomonas chlamydogama, Strain SAG 11-48b" /LENGTH=45 /DNA_ID= /DNA_START= /DNA_END= /DNA_ORIENTATION=